MVGALDIIVGALDTIVGALDTIGGALDTIVRVLDTIGGSLDTIDFVEALDMHYRRSTGGHRRSTICILHIYSYIALNPVNLRKETKPEQKKGI